jgi:dTDP-4-dehydrorhamnose 3,5-epimerase
VRVTPTALPGVVVVQPRAFGDERGWFLEGFRADRYAALGIPGPWVQDNVSRSARGVLRGLHFQHPNAQGKLVQVLEGEVFDVAVDVRLGSPTFGRWTGATLSSRDHAQLWIPAGFAHGFVVTSEWAVFAYKCTDYYYPESERVVRWDDPAIGIEWPVNDPMLSPRDREAPRLVDLAHDHLPPYGVEAAP